VEEKTRTLKAISQSFANGFLPFSFTQGIGGERRPVEVRGAAAVADGRWHSLRARFGPRYLEISVDGMARTARPSADEMVPSSNNGGFAADSPLYFGGVAEEHVGQAAELDVAATNESQLQVTTKARRITRKNGK